MRTFSYNAAVLCVSGDVLIASYSIDCTLTCKSIRSNNGPDNLLIYFTICWREHTHCLFLSPKNPHGHGFNAATSKNYAGNETLCGTREIETVLLSRGWRNASSVSRLNSVNSSKNKMP